MKMRRADKRYQPRHGGTWGEDLRRRAAGAGNALGWLAAIGVVGVTGFLLRDDLIGGVRDLFGESAGARAAAGWLVVIASAGTTAGFLLAATRLRLRSQALLLSLYAAGAASAAPALWFLPTRGSATMFGHADLDLVRGTEFGWVTLALAGCTVLAAKILRAARRVADPWNRRWLLGTAAAAAVIASLVLAVAVAHA
ncbi:hypothetical protein AB0M02_08340 [Actinoplanes sp. NPDC051861]|uniref:hypothetical protein n=1 Tax=Actinoplanes sp. NPDC051861 TaxID=3155170 RepID=UPI00343447DE